MTLAELVLRLHNWRHGVAKHKAATRKTVRPLRAGALSAASINWMAFFDPVDSHPDIVLRAVAARSLAKAQAQIDSYGLGGSVRAYGSYEELAADPDIDVVYIGLINCYHVEWAIKCMEGGKHVLLEKPAVTHAAEFDLLKACSDRTGKVVLEAMHWLFHPAAHAVKSLIESGKYGAVRSVNSRMTLHSGILTPNDPRFKYEYAGGASMDLIYVVSAAAYFSGLKPESTVAIQKATPRLSGTDPLVDEAMVTELSIKASDSSPAAVSCSLRCDLRQPKLLHLVPKMWESVPVCTVELDKAQIYFETFVGSHLSHSIVVNLKDEQGKLTGEKETLASFKGGSVWGEMGERWWTSYRYQLEAFVRVVRAVDNGDGKAVEGFQPWLSLEESKAVMAVVDAIYDKAGLPRRKSAPQKE
ncbi:NAD binding Rossmann fold oxidoreductase [Cordyceps javanica]|uniref:D-xylose 1-dehydrogenase (NADP(+), D-xylono-1,5-lactone-forming) n=1 Tax=Cordyceps javanica TaxID=43265 RepID=A0A545VWQ3_9HYPO|nr:NAD binding Rossmann fold oxidoreductase [Cordyceps javanica]TQW06135.1 NAD binding Rossmann fold oxidoreductase [Cordyceps javanica]